MKNMLKKTILSFIIILILMSKASALTVTGYASSSSSSKPNPYKQSANPDGIIPTSEMTKLKIAFVGVLVSLIDYQNTKGPEEKVLAKMFYITGIDGVFQASYETENYWAYDDHSDYYTDNNGKMKNCGNTDYYNAYISHVYYEINYGEPTRSASLISTSALPIQNNRSHSFTSSNLEQTIEGELIPEIINEYDKHRTILGYRIEEEIFDKYYLKYEPVYRSFPPIMKAREEYAGTDDDMYRVADNMEKYRDYDVTNPSDLGEEPTEHLRTLECGHTISIGKFYDCKKNYSGLYPDEEKCTKANNSWVDGVCYHDSVCQYDDDDTNPDHVDNYNCYARSSYQYSAVKLDGVKTTMSTAREGYTQNTSLLNSLYTGYSKNQYPVVNEYGLATGGSDYFVGTTYNNAIAISNRGVHKFDSTKHKYYLVESGTESYTSSKTLGMAVYNVSELLKQKDECTTPPCSCSEACSSISDKSSDNYLRCAQTYCDSHIKYSTDTYATDLKRNCILDKDECDYKPKTPVDCENPVDNKIKVGSSTDGTDGRTISDSSCGYTGSLYNDDNRTVKKQRGSYYYCSRMGNAVKTTDFNGKTYYKYGVSNTTDSYINIECRESTGFDFTDLSLESIAPGTGYEYSTYLDGNKTCRMFFDTVSWEFDFASTHSLDKIRKRLLIQKVNAFNLLATNKSGGVKINGSELLGKVIDQEGTTEKLTLDDVEDDLIYLSALNFNVTDAKATSKSKVTEYVDEKADTNGNKVYEEGDSFNLEITDRHVSTSYNSIKGDIDGLNLYHDYVFDEGRQLNEEGFREVNKYTVSAQGFITYSLPELCVSTDNRRTLKRTNDGTCSSLGQLFNKSVPLRKYFTNFSAKDHETLNNMNNKVYVKKSYFTDSVSESEIYLKGEDTCVYNLPEPETTPQDSDISCEIYVEKSATCYKSNDLYISTEPSVTAKLIINNNTNDIIDIDSQKIEVENMSVVGEKAVTFGAKDMKTVSSSGATIKSDTKIKLKGTLKFHSNSTDYVLSSDTIICSKEMNIIKASSSCTITKDGTGFWVTPNGSGDVYATVESNKDTNGNLIFNKLTYEENGKYYYQLITDSSDEVIIAKIDDGTDTNYCTYVPTNCPSIKACVELFTPEQTKKISDYCSTDYAIDKYHYDSPKLCYQDCSTRCPGCDPNKKFCTNELTASQREKFSEVDTFCKGSDSAQEYDDCMNDCLNINPPGSSPYVFRPINLNNPFPSSRFSINNGYQIGKRAVGQEWQIHYNKITDDKEQVMTGQEPEYVIELNVSKINAIRSDTNNRNDGLESGSIYSDTTNIPKVASCTSTGYTGYCSSFIHEDFTDYFKVVMGHAN